MCGTEEQLLFVHQLVRPLDVIKSIVCVWSDPILFDKSTRGKDAGQLCTRRFAHQLIHQMDWIDVSVAITTILQSTSPFFDPTADSFLLAGYRTGWPADILVGKRPIQFAFQRKLPPSFFLY